MVNVEQAVADVLGATLFYVRDLCSITSMRALSPSTKRIYECMYNAAYDAACKAWHLPQIHGS